MAKNMLMSKNELVVIIIYRNLFLILNELNVILKRVLYYFEYVEHSDLEHICQKKMSWCPFPVLSIFQLP